MLHLCVAGMNNTVHHTTGHTPYSVVFNKKPHFPGLNAEDSEFIEKRRSEIYDRIVKSKEKYAQKVKIPRLDPGTRVTIRYHSKAPRIPGIIVEDNGGMIAVVKKIGVNNLHAVTRVAKRHLWVTKVGKDGDIVKSVI